MSSRRAKRGFFSLFWDGLVSSYGATSAALGLIAGAVAWRYAASISVPLWVVATAAVTIVIPLIVSLVQALRLATQMIGGAVRVIDVQLPYSPYETSKCVCLIEPDHSVTLAIGSVTTFYRTIGGYEKLVGVGTVRHLQEDGRYQVTIDGVVRGVDDYVKLLCDQKKEAVEQLRVVTGFSASHMERLLPESKALALSQGAADVASEPTDAPEPSEQHLKRSRERKAAQDV